ncbi:MAG: phosphotransferase family protein [Steroidobacteraceae bacterium]
MRDDAMKRVAAMEHSAATALMSTGVADVSQSRLEAYLQKRLGGSGIRVTEFRLLSGGRNRQTASFRIEGTDDIPSDLVIQRESPVAMTTLSGISMQYAVLQQAHLAGVKVPRPLMLELSRDPLGAPFMITERVRGVCPVPSMDYWSPPPASEKLAASLAEQLALVHRIPLEKLEGAMDRYVDRRKGQTWLSDIHELEAQWQTLCEGPSMAVSASLAWMRAHVECVDAVEVVVHNDALLHNVLSYHEQITAVLDWEMAHIGHPFEDLGYVRPVVEQMTEWPRFVDAYIAAGGRRPSQEQIDFFTLRSILKLAIQVLYVRNAFNTGKANVPALAEIGASFLPKLIDRLAGQLNRIVC